MSGPFANIARLLHAARVLAKHDALVPREYLDRLPASAKFARRILGLGAKAGDLSLPPGVRLAHALESLGPAYIKLGQILATRPDVVGNNIAEALEMAWGYPETKRTTFDGERKQETWTWPGGKRIALLIDGRVTELR